jgi:predicted O-methyltransferase YrrM
VKQDFNLYSPLVKPQGLIIFHDITTHPSEYQIDVSKFWNEIKGGFQIKEIQYPPKKTHDITVYGGIGIILKN